MPILRTNTYLLLRSPLGEILRYEEPIYTTIKYGYLYNWYAATDNRNITSSYDWRVLTYSQMLSLQTAIGGSTNGGKLKETGFTYWNSPNTGATNELGFNGKGAGIRTHLGGVFSGINVENYYWSSTDYGSGAAYVFRLFSTSSNMIVTNAYYDVGCSIRLIYTGSGTPSSYVGNDGKVYRIVTVNGVTYTADSLAETKYRTGDFISVVTDNSTWDILTTEARCVYNNDESNM